MNVINEEVKVTVGGYTLVDGPEVANSVDINLKHL